MWNDRNIFLKGPHAPHHGEGESLDLPVTGRIPRELDGTLWTVTSSPLFEPMNAERYHWFEGDGMVHAISIRDGQARVRNRYVETAALKAEKAAGRALYGNPINGGSRATPPADGPATKNPANTNAMLVGGRLLIFCESGLPHELDRQTLATRGQYDFGGIQGPVTAHGRFDPDNGDLLFYGVAANIVNWYRADQAGRLVETHAFDMGVPSLLHDFAVTRDYAVFIVNPTIFDFENMAAGRAGMVWEPDLPTRIAVLRRRDGVVRMIETPEPFAPTHFLNAWQDGDDIVIDANRTRQFAMARPDIDGPVPVPWFSPAAPWRWRIRTTSWSLSEEQVSDINCEFPRHNDGLVGKQVRYGYYAATRGRGFCDNWLFDHTLKLDLTTGRAEFQDMGGALVAPGESIFIPRPGGIAEDDGWVLNLWWNPATDRSELVILNAQDFGAEPAARVQMPHRIPLGFHGNWVPGTSG